MRHTASSAHHASVQCTACSNACCVARWHCGLPCSMRRSKPLQCRVETHEANWVTTCTLAWHARHPASGIWHQIRARNVRGIAPVQLDRSWTPSFDQKRFRRRCAGRTLRAILKDREAGLAQKGRTSRPSSSCAFRWSFHRLAANDSALPRVGCWSNVSKNRTQLAGLAPAR